MAPTSKLLSIAAELRNEIFLLAGVLRDSQGAIKPIKMKDLSSALAITQINQQTRSEVKPVFWTVNIFNFQASRVAWSVDSPLTTTSGRSLTYGTHLLKARPGHLTIKLPPKHLCAMMRNVKLCLVAPLDSGCRPSPFWANPIRELREMGLEKLERIEICVGVVGGPRDKDGKTPKRAKQVKEMLTKQLDQARRGVDLLGAELKLTFDFA